MGPMRYLLVLLLTGCALTPADLRQLGRRNELTSTKAPIDVARCLTRAAEEFRPRT